MQDLPRFILVILTLLLVDVFGAGSVWAQPLSALGGNRVRLTLVQWRGAQPEILVGELVTITTDSLTVASGRQRKTVSRQALQRVQVDSGRRRTGRGALIGALAGGFTTGTFLALGWGCESYSFYDCELPAFGIGAIPGTLLGGIVGAAVGRATVRWEQVPVDTTLGFFLPQSGLHRAHPVLTLRIAL